MKGPWILTSILSFTWVPSLSHTATLGNRYCQSPFRQQEPGQKEDKEELTSARAHGLHHRLPGTWSAGTGFRGFLSWGESPRYGTETEVWVRRQQRKEKGRLPCGAALAEGRSARRP